MNCLKPKMKQNKRRIIKEKAGEMGHIDTHYLSKSIIAGQSKHRYLVCVVDSCTRVAWAEVVEDIKSLTVMFAALKCFNILADQYNIKFKEVQIMALSLALSQGLEGKIPAEFAELCLRIT